ncbi:TPA: hypothetical protein DCZ46_01020 [Candidatus Campbellbacteria bacterium]|nr:MAG: extracellular ligand-binding receptor, branched-chain amino acid transport system substrate-binding protein [Candidatus Campbellbacteria bacterium GW2011_OD1_34_28]HAP73837.1 hypothetical protein [Candidatus Campbellbacteria bacterium]HAQ02185.1 hypothetical protein [Candidatus Campbellbacteria bacterium]HBC70532.1 hypothetical protein [Candidatus Campbellbacteria bacterium]
MDNTMKWIVGIIILVAVIWFGYSSFNKGNENDGPIKVGILAPLSGEAASWGENFLAGAELAKKEINDAGGVDGRMIEFVIEDDQCDSTAGVSAINKLINIDKVDVIAGPVCSSVGGPVLPIVQEKGIPSIILASAPDLTAIGDYIFRTYPSDSFQGKFGADYVFNDLGKKKVAIIYVKNDWGQGLDGSFIKRFEELGGQIVYNEGISQDTNDLRTQIGKVKASEAEILYFLGYPGNAVAGLKQMKDLALGIPVLGADALAGEEVVSSAGAEGMMYTVGKFDKPEDFVQKIKTLPGKENMEVNNVAPIGYDTIKAFEGAMKIAGTNKEDIKTALSKLSIPGISTPTIEFDEVGDLKTTQANVMIIKGGKAEVLK